MRVYAVEYSNYHPPETDSLWLHEKAAEQRCKALNKQARQEGPSDSDNWEVNPRHVDEAQEYVGGSE